MRRSKTGEEYVPSRYSVLPSCHVRQYTGENVLVPFHRELNETAFSFSALISIGENALNHSSSTEDRTAFRKYTLASRSISDVCNPDPLADCRIRTSFRHQGMSCPKFVVSYTKQGVCKIEFQPPHETMLATFSFPESPLGPGVSTRHGPVTPFLCSTRSDARYPGSEIVDNRQLVRYSVTTRSTTVRYPATRVFRN
jgi:hypothetical protein